MKGCKSQFHSGRSGVHLSIAYPLKAVSTAHLFFPLVAYKSAIKPLMMRIIPT
jgi:hypothetical protein